MYDEEGFTVADLNESLKDAFARVNDVDLGTEERKEAHKEAMDLLEARIKMQQIIDEDDRFERKATEEAKQRKKDRGSKIVEAIIGGFVKILAVGGTTLLSLRLYDFAEKKDGFLSKDRANAINQLNKNI